MNLNGNWGLQVDPIVYKSLKKMPRRFSGRTADVKNLLKLAEDVLF